MLRGRFFLISTRGYAETRGASVGTDILHISSIGVRLYLGLKTLPTFHESNAVFGILSYSSAGEHLPFKMVALTSMPNIIFMMADDHAVCDSSTIQILPCAWDGNQN